ncbi:MAG: DUF6465 family protein [Dorea sp.]|nr:DUF6465 family protein [Dorea sp.]
MAKKINIEEVTEMVNKTAEMVSEKVPTEAKERVKKATKKASSTVKKTAKKAAEKVTPVQETFVEFDGEQVLVEEIVAKIKEAYKAEGHRVSSIKSLRTYVNLYERKAYYVINEKPEDKFVEF